MYLSAITLANLVLTKAVFQMLRLQVHTPSITPKSDILFQITFSNLSGALLHTETVKGHVISFLVSRV